jgi:hypothetical protein
MPIEEIIGALVPLVFFVLWVIKQIREAKNPAAPRPQQPNPPRPQPRPQPPAAQAGPAGPANQQADPLREQVQEFLRRTQQQPANRQRPAARRDAREIEVLVPAESADEVRRTIAEPFRPMQAPSTPRPIVLATSAESPRSTVPAHVSAGSRLLGRQTSQLGQRIIAEDEQFDVQLKAKFDHTVGSLASARPSESPLAPKSPGDSPAGQIVAMLKTPGGMQQAVVLNEILRRPTDRW